MLLLKKPITIVAACLSSFLFIFATPKPAASPVTIVRPVNKPNGIESSSVLFSELHLREAGMKQSVFNSAILGLEKLEEEGILKRSDILTIADFSQPSSQKRFYVLDLIGKQILFNTWVAHGRNSGKLWAHSFSNRASSLKSSPGFYVTAETYMGDNGYSLRLDGLEKNINDNARSREIVLHGAPYMEESSLQSNGFMGRSWGCPAIPLSIHQAIIDTIKEGSCLFIYSPDKNYLKRSSLLKS